MIAQSHSKVESITSSAKTTNEENTHNTSKSIPNRGMNNTRSRGSGLRRRQRRSTSAPAGYNRKNNRRSLVQQHFKIDKESKALLPGVPVHDDDFARDMHDFFNLIVLVPIVVLNVLNWNWDMLLYGNSKGGELPFVHAWTGEYFYPFFWTTVAYFLVDLVWVCVIPRCVKSPSTIIQHHVAVFVYLTLPYLYPRVRFLMGVCMRFVCQFMIASLLRLV